MYYVVDYVGYGWWARHSVQTDPSQGARCQRDRRSDWGRMSTVFWSAKIGGEVWLRVSLDAVGGDPANDFRGPPIPKVGFKDTVWGRQTFFVEYNVKGLLSMYGTVLETFWKLKPFVTVTMTTTEKTMCYPISHIPYPILFHCWYNNVELVIGFMLRSCYTGTTDTQSCVRKDWY
jgi:hypothetical protein